MTFDAGTAEQLGLQSAATVGEVRNGVGIVDAAIRPLFVPCRVAGPAFPVALPLGDNLSLHHALARAPRGSVLVVACADAKHGFWGEIAAIAALERGISGLVTNGAVRDTDALRKLQFPVFCGGINIRGTEKEETGSIGVPVNLGGVPVRANDYVIADSDGIVIVPADAIGNTLQAARAREEREQRIITELRAGKTTIELLGLRDLADGGSR